MSLDLGETILQLDRVTRNLGGTTRTGATS